jgi:hypothetical protein
VAEWLRVASLGSIPAVPDKNLWVNGQLAEWATRTHRLLQAVDLGGRWPDAVEAALRAEQRGSAQDRKWLRLLTVELVGEAAAGRTGEARAVAEVISRDGLAAAVVRALGNAKRSLKDEYERRLIPLAKRERAELERAGLQHGMHHYCYGIAELNGRAPKRRYTAADLEGIDAARQEVEDPPSQGPADRKNYDTLYVSDATFPKLAEILGDAETCQTISAALRAAQEAEAKEEAAPAQQARELPAQPTAAERRRRGPRLRFNDASFTITLDGTPISAIDPTAYRMYRAIWDLQSNSRTSCTTWAKVQQQSGPGTTKAKRTIELLPAELRRTVQTKRGKGVWIALP